MFTGPVSRCCEAMDFTWVTRDHRQVAVCIACEKVFYDERFEPDILSRILDAIRRRQPR